MNEIESGTAESATSGTDGQQADQSSQKSISETISEAYDKVVTDTQGNSDGVNAATQNPVENRDEKGRFHTGKTEEIAGATTEKAPQVVDEVAAPHSWPKELHNHFSALPIETRKAIAAHEAAREKGLNEKLEQSAKARQLSEAFAKVVQPYMPLIQSEGGTPLGAVQTLLHTAHQIRQNPEATIKALAHRYGVNIGQQADTTVPEQSPEFTALKKELMDVKSTLTRNHQALQQQEYDKANSEIDSYKGSGKYPYFDEVRADIADLLEIGKAKTLDEGYKLAIRMNESVWTKVNAESEKTKAEEARIEAEKAKKAAQVNVKSKGAPVGVKPNGSMRDTMFAAYDAAASRV